MSAIWLSRYGSAYLGVIASAFWISACEIIADIEKFTPAPADATVSDAAPDAADAAPTVGTGQNGCPSGRGPAMIRHGARCIDSTEVTEAQYASFLASQPATQDGECAWNASFVPGEKAGEPPICFPAGPAFPQGCVDYCDAKAFCAWAGKSLCGAPGGGTAAFDRPADSMASEWYDACVGANAAADGGVLVYPYGASYLPDRCNGADRASGQLAVAGGLAGCEGGLSGLFDMSGNVWEWEDSCESYASGADANATSCRIRGGSLTDGPGKLVCASSEGQARDFQQYNLGFRCCASAR